MKRTFSQRLIALLLLVFSAFSMVSVANAETTYGEYNTRAVFLRPSPGSSDYYGKAQLGTTCIVLGSQYANGEEWYNVTITSNTSNDGINLNGKTGWSMARYIDITSGEAPGGSSGNDSGDNTGGSSSTSGAYINMNQVNIRQSASTDAKLVGQVNKNTTLSILAEVEGENHRGTTIWLKVTVIKTASGSKHNIDGESGYVNSYYVSGYTVSGNTNSGSNTGNSSGTSKPEDKGVLKNGFIKGTNVNVRELPGTSNKSLGLYSYIPILYYSGTHEAGQYKWYHIIKPIDGYVCADYVDGSSSAASYWTKLMGPPYCATCKGAMTQEEYISFTHEDNYHHIAGVGAVYYAKARYRYACPVHDDGTTMYDGAPKFGYAYYSDTSTSLVFSPVLPK